ncbi:hypothetical protein D3C86_1966420 [compost metagenome]
MHDGLRQLAVRDDLHFGLGLEGERQMLVLGEFFARAKVEFRAGHALRRTLGRIEIDQGVDLGGVVAVAVLQRALAGLHAHNVDDLIELHGDFL